MASIKNLLSISDSKINKMRVEQTRDLIKGYKKALGEVKLKISAMYQKYGNEVKFGDMQKYNRLVNLEMEIFNVLKSMVVNDITVINKSVKSVYTQSFKSVGSVLQSHLQTDVLFGLIPKDAVRSNIINPLNPISWKDRTKRNIVKLNEDIKELITQSLIQGDGYIITAKKLSGSFDVAAKKAITIIKTETHRVLNQGKIDGFETSEKSLNKLGYTHEKVWRSFIDGKTRSDHISIDGLVADINGIFTLPNGVTTEGPGLSGDPDQDINCRCTIIMEIKNI